MYKKLLFATLLLLLPFSIALVMAFGGPLKNSPKNFDSIKTAADGGGKDIFDELLQKSYKLYPDFYKWVTETRSAIQEAQELDNFLDRMQSLRNRYYQEAEAEANAIADISLRESVLKKIAQSKANYESKLKELQKKVSEVNELIQKLRDLEKALNVSYTLELLEKEYPMELDAAKIAKITEKLKELIARGEKDYYN